MPPAAGSDAAVEPSVAGVEAGDVLASGIIDLAAPLGPVTAAASALVTRDWPTILGVRLNDNGDPVPFEP